MQHLLLENYNNIIHCDKINSSAGSSNNNTNNNICMHLILKSVLLVSKSNGSKQFFVLLLHAITNCNGNNSSKNTTGVHDLWLFAYYKYQQAVSTCTLALKWCHSTYVSHCIAENCWIYFLAYLQWLSVQSKQICRKQAMCIAPQMRLRTSKLIQWKG